MEILVKILDCTDRINNESFIYVYDENTLINDLYKYIAQQYPDCLLFYEKDYANGFAIGVNGGFKNAIPNYPLVKFMSNWGINAEEIIVKCNIAFGVGGGFRIKQIAKVRINPDEGKHQYLPHVHIMKAGKTKPQYRISLKDFQQLDSDAEKWERSFGRRQRQKIIEVLKENQATLLDYYERIHKGEHVVDRILIFVDGETVEFK